MVSALADVEITLYDENISTETNMYLVSVKDI
jgi:hypothetical protein